MRWFKLERVSSSRKSITSSPARSRLSFVCKREPKLRCQQSERLQENLADSKERHCQHSFGWTRCMSTLPPPCMSISSLCFSTAVQDRKERCPPRQESRVERLKAKVEPLLTEVTMENREEIGGERSHLPTAWMPKRIRDWRVWRARDG